MRFTAVETKEWTMVTSIIKYENCVILCSPKGVAEHNILPQTVVLRLLPVGLIHFIFTFLVSDLQRRFADKY
jgi:uncharacterized PurR-regulated membrane protein YhhQ (DUF165 family)